MAQYDINGNATAVKLPQAVGYDPAKSFRGYGAAHDVLDRMTAVCGDPAGCGSYAGNLGATWSWGGTSRLYSVVNRGPMKTSHRYVWAYGAVPQTSQWHLGNLAIGSYGTNDLAEKWGEFSYGYRTGDVYKETRSTANLPVQANANTGLFSQQGFRWTLDGARRLQKAEAGAFDEFKLEYGAGDELKSNVRDASGTLTNYKAGARGRITERAGTPYTYDAEGRRLSDERFDLQWNWRGELVKANVRLDWTGSPYAGHQIRFE